MATLSGRWECKQCQYCGKRLSEDEEIFCILPFRGPGLDKDICMCVCKKCREKFLKEPPSKSK